MSSRHAEIKLQPGGSKAKAPPPGCHLSVCPLTQAGHHLPTILSVHLPTYTCPPIHPSLHLSAHLFAGRASTCPSICPPPSFCPSIRVHLPVHPLCISQPSILKPDHAPLHHSPTSLSVHPRTCVDALPALQSIHLSTQLSIHLSVQLAIHQVDIQEDKWSGYKSSTSPGKAETWNPTH